MSKRILIFLFTYNKLKLFKTLQAIDDAFIEKMMTKMVEIGEKCAKETGASDGTFCFLSSQKNIILGMEKFKDVRDTCPSNILCH